MHTSELLKKMYAAAGFTPAERVENVLILFEFERFIIGDTCDRLSKLSICNYAFPGAAVAFHGNKAAFGHLLRNNPYVVQATYGDDWHQIDFLRYQVVVCVTYREPQLLEHLASRYEPAAFDKLPVVFSARGLHDEAAHPSFVFPDFRPSGVPEPLAKRVLRNEIFISPAEREWADDWLRRRGVAATDQLLVVIDSSNSRAKLLNTNVYFSVLRFLLQISNSKVLIFDENGLGKSRLYKAWMGSAFEGRFIFAEKTDLRQSLCLLSSTFVRLIFGPCTGLLHCASGIYNVLMQNGLPPERLPVMLTYRGSVKGMNDNPYRWWGNSLVDCVLVNKAAGGGAEVKLLTEADKDINTALRNLLPSSEFTAEMLLHFMQKRYGRLMQPVRTKVY